MFLPSVFLFILPWTAIGYVRLSEVPHMESAHASGWNTEQTRHAHMYIYIYMYMCMYVYMGVSILPASERNAQTRIPRIDPGKIGFGFVG